MRTQLMKNAARCLVATALITCSLVPSVITAAPSQTTSPAPSTARVTTLNSSPVLARNTATKTEIPTVNTASKEKKVQDKKTIGRCWQRLMTTFREMHSAHRASQTSK